MAGNTETVTIKKSLLNELVEKIDELQDRLLAAERLNKARGSGSGNLGSGEVGVVAQARHTRLTRPGYDPGARISKAHAAKDEPVRKGESEIGIAKAAIQHGRVRGR
jgi:hypothetical protein